MNTTKKTLALVHKTWLAGVGAFDNGREKAADKVDQLFVDGSAFVNVLLEKGESIEMQIQAKLEVRNMLKDKITALRAKLGFGNESRDQQIDTLTQRVDSLIEVVAKLAQQKLAEKKSTATQPKKDPVKSASAAILAAAKPAAAKPAAVKPAAAKLAAVKPAATKPAAVKPAAAKPAAVKPAAAKLAAVKPAATKPAAVKPAAAKPAAVKPAAAKPAAVKPAAAKPAAVKPAAAKPAAVKPATTKLDEKD